MESYSPFRASQEKSDFVDNYLANELQFSPRKPSRHIDRVKLSAIQYEDYVVFSANPATSGSPNTTSIPPLKDAISDLITQPGFYKIGIDDRIGLVQGVVKKYRVYARQLMLEKYSDLANKIQNEQQKRNAR